MQHDPLPNNYFALSFDTERRSRHFNDEVVFVRQKKKLMSQSSTHSICEAVTAPNRISLYCPECHQEGLEEVIRERISNNEVVARFQCRLCQAEHLRFVVQRIAPHALSQKPMRISRKAA